MSSIFQAGDLVVSISGDGDGSGIYTDNQATPITLEDLSTTGVVHGTLVLPQQTSVNSAGVTESAISGEYGSSSEGTLTLSANGQSLVIAGYGVNAATFNSGGVQTYGTAALAQTTSVKGGNYTAVQRTIADINYDGIIDTSTSLYNVDNTNNPRSVATVDGSSFYLTGQGVKSDATQGVFYATDGATAATAINTATDTRTAEIYNGNLYISTDSKQGPTSNIAEYNGLPTGAAAPTVLPGISQNVALAAGNGNSVNGSTGTVNLSPENFFFANANTLYVADGGQPKQGGLGDGGLQKYSLVNNVWKLDYTLSSGLNLVNATTTKAGTSGLIGLTGTTNADGTVSLFATNSTIGDTDQTYLYGITDTLADTTAAQASGESFQTLMTAAADTNIRGVAFAPQAAVTCFASGTHIATPHGDVAVENLAIGDYVITASGKARSIRWLGHRTIQCRLHRHPHEAYPIRVTAHAFGENRPSRDLKLSPGHAICLDVVGEVLIPAGALVNGTTIVQDEVDAVTYWHIDLGSHDVILAESLPCESYLDMGNKAFFMECATTALHEGPDARPATHVDFCRPFHADGPLVAFVRDRLAARSTLNGWTLQDTPLTDLHLLVDNVRISAEVRDLSARFLVPAGANDVWLVAETSVPATIGSGCDLRALGVCLGGVVIDDGFGAPRDIAADDEALWRGFHDAEPGPQRWTSGRALLPAALWGGCHGAFFLRLDLVRPPLPRWAAPRPSAVAA